MSKSIESEARHMGFSPEASAILGSFSKDTRGRAATKPDQLWTEAEQAAARFYAKSEAPNKAVKEYAYAMGYYHAKKG